MIKTKICKYFKWVVLGDGFSGSKGVWKNILVRLLCKLDLLESTYFFIFTQ